jgi:hypothetical protein
MSLERFGEIFHQKLDDCYENLGNDIEVDPMLVSVI